MPRKPFIDIICALLIFLFIYTGISKLLDYHTFRRQLGQSPFITFYAPLLAWALPLGEIIIAGMLSFNRSRLAGLYLSFFLLCLFTFYLAAMLQLSYYIPCSCGGVLQALSWQAHIILNIVFILLTAAGTLLQPKQ
ncbi:hypothetical protein SAMN05428988_4688 [Chitinophaga sp. YR573]|uniref:MauE/DoxX family redox-associated membrane protein n=1 Tax=Chitinophaga sp. YR573 TaxID=1881040 RepID=UPI0008B2E80B|nr:MauE/DoxX family redox-associated membrane protein [Chitinophaga sp. YR573]SEW37578.1 hypothetical protein SAMN05428988_4688 [Chitinophaga sp. YR573]